MLLEQCVRRELGGGREKPFLTILILQILTILIQPSHLMDSLAFV